MSRTLLPRSRYATWVAALALVAGVHVGVLAHQLLQPDDEPPCASTVVVNNEAPTVIVEHEHAERQLVHCASEHVCVIDRAALADAFARRDARLLRSVRAEPVDGGLALSGIRRQGLLGVVGLRDGDVLTRVDEHPLQSGADIEVLLQRAQQGSFRLVFQRGDRLLYKRFELIDSASFHTAKVPV